MRLGRPFPRHSGGASLRKTTVAAMAPASCATMNAGTSVRDEIFSLVFVTDRAKVSGGVHPSEVDDVNQRMGRQTDVGADP